MKKNGRQASICHMIKKQADQLGINKYTIKNDNNYSKK